MHANQNQEKPSYLVAGLATGGLLAGLLASSCCILPLALVSIGIGGSWMSTLTSLAPYQPYFLVAAAALIVWGMRQAYRKREVCLPGTVCASKTAGRVTKTLLWSGAVLALAALGIDTILPLLT